MNNIYDVIAELCSFVIRSCEEEFFVHYSCISHEEKERERSLIRERLPALFGGKSSESSSDPSGGQVKCLCERDLDEAFFQSLRTFVQEVKERADFFLAVGLAQILDQSLESLLQKKIADFQADDFVVVLNSNREATGIGLLPRCSCVWERKRRLSHCYNRMDNFLFNLLLLENTILGELIDKHFFLKKNLFPNFAQKRSLKIAASPLCLERGFNVVPYVEDKVQYFKISGREDGYEKMNELVWQKILCASERQSDIAVFPEMLGNPGMADFISQKIKSLPAEQAALIPSLLILPSYWENRRNAVPILDRFGNVLCHQNKQNPFRVEQGGAGLLEGIAPSLVVNIFHFEGIGRIAILICKDFLTTKYMEQLMRCFKLTLIIVPSFSTGSYDFRQSFDLCAHDDCNVAWINTCAALEKGKEANFESVGYVRKRISRDEDESQKLCNMPICSGAFKGECARDCIYYEEMGAV